MFTKLTDTTKGATFAVLVLCMAVGAALLIRFLDITSNLVMFSIWSCTPTVATLIMLLVVTREGYTKEGWKSLGLHRLGLNVWWIAFGVTLLITVAASAVVWATPLASFVVPECGILDPILSFFIFFGMTVVWFGLAEEIGMRGYLQLRLMSLGRRAALVVVGVVFATWHLPLIFLAPAAANFPTGPVAVLPAFLRDLHSGELLLRVPEDLHGQHLARLHRPCGAQRCVGCTGSGHPDNGFPGVG